MKALDWELLNPYNLSVKSYVYSRSNYYLNTSEGQMVLRKVNISSEQIAFIYEVYKQLKAHGLEMIDSIYETKKKMPYVMNQDKIYILQKYGQRDEVDFQNKQDLIHTMRCLGQFHIAAQNIESKQKDLETLNMKNLYTYCEKRYIESQKLYKSIQNLSQKTSFEIAFIKGYRIYQNLEELALREIDFELCEELMSEAKQSKCIAHNDFSYQCIQKQQDNKYMITNIDYCGYDVQVIDIAHVLTKIMQKNNWDISLLRCLLEEYMTIYALTPKHLRLLKAMMIFPKKYANICHKYTHSKRRHYIRIFESKWENMLLYQEQQVKAAYEIHKYL